MLPLEIQQFTRTFKEFLVNKMNSPNKTCTQNMNTEQRNLLKKLKENHNILVKKAEKGAAVVILKTSDYLKSMCQPFGYNGE